METDEVSQYFWNSPVCVCLISPKVNVVLVSLTIQHLYLYLGFAVLVHRFEIPAAHALAGLFAAEKFGHEGALVGTFLGGGNLRVFLLQHFASTAVPVLKKNNEDDNRDV